MVKLDRQCIFFLTTVFKVQKEVTRNGQRRNILRKQNKQDIKTNEQIKCAINCVKKLNEKEERELTRGEEKERGMQLGDLDVREDRTTASLHN